MTEHNVIEEYKFAAGREYMRRFLPDAAVQIIFIPALFEEYNRLNKTIADVMRGLAERGIGCVLPDLPAMGESLAPFFETSLADWHEALAALVVHIRPQCKTLIVAAFRGGALIDPGYFVDGYWQLAPESGARLLRDMRRVVLARGVAMRDGDDFDELGYALPSAFVAALEQALPASHAKQRIVRLAADTQPADGNIAGAPLWRRSEPEEDETLTQGIVADLADWAVQCAKF